MIVEHAASVASAPRNAARLLLGSARLDHLNFECDRRRRSLGGETHQCPDAVGAYKRKTGAQFGIWRGLLACLGWPYVVVTPQAWRKSAGIVVPRKGDPKAATVRHVGRLLPDVDLVPSPRARKPHDGLADALGMALACRAMHKGGQL